MGVTSGLESVLGLGFERVSRLEKKGRETVLGVGVIRGLRHFNPPLPRLVSVEVLVLRDVLYSS